MSSVKQLSPAALASQYFSTAKRTAAPARAGNELTPTARFVANAVRLRLADTESTAPTEAELSALVADVEASEGEELSAHERTAVVAVLAAGSTDFDVLSPLVENPAVNDIIVRAFDDVSVQANRRNVQTDLRFADESSYRAFVENLLKRAGRSCTTATPVVDATLDERIRLCVTHESFSPPGSGPMLTMRIARHDDITLDGLLHHELAPKQVLDYLGALTRSNLATILVAGEVGTGKTTLVRALASRIPEDQALLIIEDTHEVVLSRPFVRTLLTREPNTEGVGRISPALAIRTGMRMAMNRLLLGEMRDAETAEAFIDVCASGHPGMSTIHARSGRDAIARLELFLSRAQAGAGIETIRRQIAQAVSVVVFLGVDALQRRRIVEVLEIGSFADGAIQCSPIFKQSVVSGVPVWRRESGISSFREMLEQEGAALGYPGATFNLDPEAASAEVAC